MYQSQKVEDLNLKHRIKKSPSLDPKDFRTGISPEEMMNQNINQTPFAGSMATKTRPVLTKLLNSDNSAASLRDVLEREIKREMVSQK